MSEKSNKCEDLIGRLSGLTLKVSLPGRGRTCLKKPGLKELAKDCGVLVKSRMTKADLWDEILLTEVGESLAEFINNIAKEQSLEGPMSMKSTVEMSWKGDDEEMVDTGVHSVGASAIAPVLKDENGLEQILHLWDSSPKTSNVEVRKMEEIKCQIEEVRSDWISKLRKISDLKDKVKKAKYDALAPKIAEDLQKGIIMDYLESFWDATFEPKLDSPEVRKLSRYNQKARRTETLLYALGDGKDTFLDRTMTRVIRYEGEYGARRKVTLLVLKRTDSWRASSNVKFKVGIKRFARILDYQAVLKKLRKNYWEKVHPSAKLKARWNKFNELKAALGEAFEELTAAKESRDDGAIKALEGEMNALNWETRSAYWNEFRWMVHIPSGPDQDRYKRSSDEILGDCYNPGAENVDAAFWHDTRSSNESKRKAHEQYVLVNGASKASNQRFVDKDIQYAYLAAIEEKEEKEAVNEMTEKDKSALLDSGYSEEELEYFEAAAEEYDEAVLEAFNS
jgi:hypothetical protein